MGARTGLVDLEDLSDEELNRLQKQFEALHASEGKRNGHIEAEAIMAATIKADRIETVQSDNAPPQ